MKKRIISLLIALIMLMGLLPMSALAKDDLGGIPFGGGDYYAADGRVAFNALENEKVSIQSGKAAEDGLTGGAAKGDTGDGSLTVLAFTSDIHNSGNNTAANRLGTWLDIVRSKHGDIDAMSFCGDMGAASGSGDSWWSYVTSVKNVVDGKSLKGIYTTGNHEFLNGSFASTSNSMKANYTVGDIGLTGSNYIVYCLGTDNWNNTQDNYPSTQINELISDLNELENDKPIIILTHFPLHCYSSRSTTNADLVIDALNNAVASGKKIVLLWGHNHTVSDTFYDEIYEPGTSIPYNRNGNTKKIQFYYGAAGCMSDSEYGGGSAYVKGKGLVITINSKNQLSFTYYDASGNNVTEGGTFTEQDPVAATGVSIVETNPTVDEGRNLQLHLEYTPSDANSNLGVTWGSSNTSVATVDKNGLVSGVNEGTATITVTAADGSYTASRVVTVKHNDNPSEEVTVNITPTTDNPEESIKINVGDTLTIKVTNGSSNSAYDFTATLSNSGVAQIQGNTTMNIAAGGTGTFTVTGLANGTVDITIQNSNTYGSQYTRKGVIHLTVGEGGTTPVDPPSGDTVSITPSTDNPEESIKINVGDMLTIKVTNGSSNSAYDFTATLSNSSVAQIQGNTTVNIAAGGTGTFTVTGLANGTVDITIQNSNTYGSQYTRKGVIHLTVGEGGTTPVDPPSGDTVSITPSTDNPEESIKINVGDMLTIKVTNGSSNSAYDFTATLSNSGVAQIQGNTTMNIAAGGTGTFTVTGLANGTVDITIQNSNTYGSQYTRKGVIHLTVGEGGTTPVDPPSGDMVSYQLATSFKAGKEYIIANGNSGSVYVVSNEANGSRQLKGIAATVSDDMITLSAADAAKAAFTAEMKTSVSGSDSVWLTNGGKYLYTNNADGLRMVDNSEQGSTDNAGKYWHYKADGKNLLWFFKDTSSQDGYTDTTQTYKYYLEVSNGVYTDNHASTTSLSNTNTPAIFLYEKYEGALEVSGVSLDKTELTLTVGKTETLTATVIPSGATNKDVIWSSRNNSVATVDTNGKVTAVAAGTATIVVTTAENNKTATCAVTVKEPGVGTEYVLTDTLEAGKKYLIASGNTGYVYIVSNEANGSKTLKGVAVEVVGDTITIEDEIAANVVFTSVENANSAQNGLWLMSDGKYMYADSSNGLRLVESSTQTSSSNNAKSWHYKADGKNLLWFFKDTSSQDGYTDTSQTYKYYLENSNGNFTDNHVSTTSLANTNTPKIYLFVESDGATHVHSFGDWTVTIPATCTKAGVETRTCSLCGATESRDVAALGHNMTAHAAVEATCESAGNSAYWSCARCGKYFSDEAGTNEIEKDSWVITALGHNLISHDAQAPTCTEAGWDAYDTCSRCDYTTYEEIPATGHSWSEPTWYWNSNYTSATASFSCTVCGNETKWVQATVKEKESPATCTAEGKKIYTASAVFNGETYTDEHSETIPALEHDLIHHEAKAATCTEAGWDAYDACSRCDYTTYVEIPATGHSWSNPKWLWADDYSDAEIKLTCQSCGYTENVTAEVTTTIIEATCTEAGRTDYTATAEFGGKTYSDTKTRSIEKLGHIPGETVIENKVDATTEKEGSYDEVVYCERCHEELSRNHVITDKLPIPVVISAISPDTTEASVGDRVTWTAEVSGGTGTLKYRFYLYKDGNVVEKGDYGKSLKVTYTLTEPGVYTVRVYVKEANVTGSIQLTGGAVNVTEPAPNVPTNVKLASSLEGITVTWDGVQGAKKYCVIRTGDGVTTKVTVTGTSYLDTAVENEVNYTYSVQAVTAAGTYSDASESKSLFYPLGISVKVNGMHANLSWTAVTGADKYQVYRRPQVNGKYGEWELIYSAKGQFFVDAPGAGIWQYRVRAVVGTQKTAYSNRKKQTIG